jgi:hypothetical protein
MSLWADGDLLTPDNLNNQTVESLTATDVTVDDLTVDELTATGMIVAGAGVEFTGGVSASGCIHKSASLGLTMRATTGSAQDITIQSTDGTNVIYVPTGTTTLVFGGPAVVVGGTLAVTGAVSLNIINLAGAELVLQNPSGRTTIGANGAATALTANPVGYIDIDIGGSNYQIPYYNRGA